MRQTHWKWVLIMWNDIAMAILYAMTIYYCGTVSLILLSFISWSTPCIKETKKDWRWWPCMCTVHEFEHAIQHEYRVHIFHSNTKRIKQRSHRSLLSCIILSRLNRCSTALNVSYANVLWGKSVWAWDMTYSCAHIGNSILFFLYYCSFKSGE